MRSKIAIALALALALSLGLAAYPAAAEDPPPAGQAATTPQITEPAGQSASGAATGTVTGKDQPDATLTRLGVTNQTIQVLGVFLVLSLVFEVALAPIFNSKWYMARWEDKGYKTPITIILAFLVFWGYELDIVAQILESMGDKQVERWWGKVLTALLIAGGSSGVNTILARLGVRMNPQERTVRAQAAQQQLAAFRAAKGGPTP